jgi:hypothetical protein
MVHQREEMGKKLRERMALRQRQGADPPASGIHLETQVRGPFSAEEMEMVEAGRADPVLHYEFVPGLTRDEEVAEPFFWYWMLHVTDDVGTVYNDGNGGARGQTDGGVATHGVRDLGGQVPGGAKQLVITFEPAAGWTPSEPWRKKLLIDMITKTVVE